MAARKPLPPNPELMAQYRPWMVAPPMPPGGMPPGGPGKPPSTNISLRLGSNDTKDVPPQAKSAIIMAMLKKLMPGMQTGGAPVPQPAPAPQQPQPQPAPGPMPV